MEFTSLDMILDEIRQNKLIMLSFSTENCGVCMAIKPRLAHILKPYDTVKNIYIKTESLPNASGEFMVFTVPTIIMFAGGKEVHRESRIIDFKRLEFELVRWHDYLS